MIMFSVGRFTCKEHVMLIELEIRLLFCVNKRCFVTYKRAMRQGSMASHETFHETVVSSFSSLFIGLRGSCSWGLHKGKN